MWSELGGNKDVNTLAEYAYGEKPEIIAVA